MTNKEIIIIIVVIFLAFIGYKVISSSIQENKEKAVLQEKAQLQALEKEPLNQCIDNIDFNAAKDIKNLKDLIQETRSPESQANCLQPTGHGSKIDALIASGKLNLQEYCWPSFEEEDAEIQKINDKALIDKEECYKRYK